MHEKLEVRKANGTVPSVIVLGDPDWKPSLLGLVASGIADEYERPVFLWGREGSNVLKGSCRGGPGKVHVVDLMTAAGDTFTGFGGHSAAGGFSVAPDAIFTLEERLVVARASLEGKDALDPFSHADADMTQQDATPSLLAKLERLAPYGMGNPKPIFVFRDVTIHEVSWFGKSGEHLRIRIVPPLEDFSSRPLEGIAFYGRRELGKKCDVLSVGGTVTVLANLERDMFTRGRPVRLRLVALS